MKVRTRIYLLQIVIAVIVLMLAAVAYASIRYAGQYLKRVEWANHQHETITAVTVHATRFSEQIAELLLIGEAERSDYVSASRELQASFTLLEKITRGEAAFLAGSSIAKDPSDELYRVRRMRALHAEIDRSVATLVALRNQGRTDEAVELFRREIENRLDAEFEHLLQAAVLDEEEEVEQAEREADALWRRLVWIIALVTLSALAICLVTALRLARALIGPIAQLTAGTEAISRGELDHRIAYRSSDELGALAQHFNRMGEQLEVQRLQVRAAHTNLERDVADRTRELAAANKRLSAMDRLRVQFLADISHELRTPLTALRGEAEIALRHLPRAEPAYRDVLERIVALSCDMGRLVADLLFLARSETDTLHFELRPLSLRDLLLNVETEGKALGRGRGIEVLVEYPAEPIWISADAQRLKQAFMIVLDNAIKYSPAARPVHIVVTTTEQRAEIVVRDQGYGIGAEEMPYVFDRFYRGQTRGGSGSGLGLAIAKWLVEKHGGDIALTSEPERFTEVRIRIPRIEEATRAQDFAG